MAKEQTTNQREVKFLFRGLFFFSFEEERTEGRVGLLSVNPRHDLKVTIKRIGGELKFTVPYSSIRRLQENVFVKKKTTKAQARAQTLPPVNIHGGWTRPGASVAAETNDGLLPFGFIADFEGIELHGLEFPGGAPKRPGRLHPTLRFNAGTFYTEELTEKGITITRPGEDDLDLGPLAEVIGVKVSLAPGEELVCEIEGHIFSLDDVSVVSLEHICPTCDDEPEEENDMKLYYDLLDIPTSMQFIFKRPARVHPAICINGGGSRTFNL